MTENLEMSSAHSETASDKEVAEQLAAHILAPCNPGQGQEHLHVGTVYVREAERLLKEMLAKPQDKRDDNAIFTLESALRRYREVFVEL